MIIEERGRFIYFKDINDEDLNLLKEILIKKTIYNGEVTREVNMLFNDDNGNYYTYFGYKNYIKLKFASRGKLVYIKKDKNKDFEEIDYDKIKEGLKNIKLRDYQVRAVIKCLKRRFGTVVASVGAGKTAIMASLVNYVNKNTLIVCPTSQLVKQNINKFIQYGVDEDLVGELSGSNKNIRKITIGTFQTIKTYIDKYPDLMSKFNVILFEESHSSQQSDTGRFIDKFYEDKAEYIIGFTGTLYRYDNIEKSIEDFIMLGITGEPIDYISIKELVDKGYLTEPVVYLEPIKSYVYNYKSWNKVYKFGINNNKTRNNSIVNWIELFDKHNLTSLTLIYHKKHGEMLFSLLPEEIRDKTLFVCGNNKIYRWSYGRLEWYNTTYDDIMEEFNKPDGKWKHFIATQVFSTGTDLPTLNAVILAYVGKSFVQVIQRLGRVVRKHPSKSKVFIIDFFDDTHVYLRKQSKDRINIYKKEGIKIEHDYNKLLFDLKMQQILREKWIKEVCKND